MRQRPPSIPQNQAFEGTALCWAAEIIRNRHDKQQQRIIAGHGSFAYESSARSSSALRPGSLGETNKLAQTVTEQVQQFSTRG